MHWSDPSVVITIVIAAVTLLYTVLTGLIWHATWQNTKATRDVLEASHRPYIGILEAKLGGHYIGETLVVISISNVGSIPARAVKIDLELRSGDAKRKISGSENPIALFPGQSFSASFALANEEVSYLGSGFDVETAVTYQGMTDKEHATYCTCSYRNVLDGFTVSAGHFD